MKTLKNISVSLAILFIVSLKTSNGQILEIIKGVQVVLNVVMKAQEILGPMIDPKKAIDVGAHRDKIVNQKLDNIHLKIQKIEENLIKNFKLVLERVSDTPNATVSLLTAQHLEESIIGIEKELKDIVLFAKQLKKRDPPLSADHQDLSKLDGHSKTLKDHLETFRSIVEKKKISLDYLESIKEKAANVCVKKKTQLLELDNYRVLYVETVFKYLLSQHLLIAMYELLGMPDRKNYKKIEINQLVQSYFDDDLSRFQSVMATASREFQNCAAPVVTYKVGGNFRNEKCYVIDANNEDQPARGLITAVHLKNSDIKTDHFCWYYFSLRPANAKPGYVVIGVKIERSLNILYVRVIQAKLLPNGLVDLETISYNDDTEHGIGDEVVKIRWGIAYQPHQHQKATHIDLTPTVARGDRVVTGLRFARSKQGHVYLEVTSTKINLEEGILYENTREAVGHIEGKHAYAVRKSKQRSLPAARNSLGLQPVKPDQYVDFVATHGYYPYISGDAVIPTPVSLLSGVSLYVKEVKNAQGFLSFRFHTFDIVPHINITLDENTNFTSVIQKL